MVTNLPAMLEMWLETQVPPLGQEDLLEREIAIHSNIFAWEIPRTGEPGRLQSIESQKSQTQLSK